VGETIAERSQKWQEMKEKKMLEMQRAQQLKELNDEELTFQPNTKKPFKRAIGGVRGSVNLP